MVETEQKRRQTGGYTISEKETRGIIVRALMNHNYIRAYRNQWLLVARQPSTAGYLVFGSEYERSPLLARPSVVNTTAGCQARRVLIAAMSGEGVTYEGLKRIVGPLQKEFFTACRGKRLECTETGDSSNL